MIRVLNWALKLVSEKTLEAERRWGANATQRDSKSNLLTGWKEPNLNPDQGYDDVHTRKWSFVIDISVINPC